jgi:hypothetical protein
VPAMHPAGLDPARTPEMSAADVAVHEEAIVHLLLADLR